MKKNDAFMERMQAEMSGFDRVEDIAQIYQIIEEWVVCTVCEVVAAKRELDLVSEWEEGEKNTHPSPQKGLDLCPP